MTIGSMTIGYVTCQLWNQMIRRYMLPFVVTGTGDIIFLQWRRAPRVPIVIDCHLIGIRILSGPMNVSKHAGSQYTSAARLKRSERR
jgi:hypothetical protein